MLITQIYRDIAVFLLFDNMTIFAKFSKILARNSVSIIYNCFHDYIKSFVLTDTHH